MRSTVIGTGKLGLATAASLADSGHQVLCVDSDEHRVEQLSQGLFPGTDVELTRLLSDLQAGGQIQFTCMLSDAVAAADTVFLAVDTPFTTDGGTDLRQLWIVIDMLMYYLQSDAKLVIKSAVPRETSQRVADRISRMTWREFDVVSHC